MARRAERQVDALKLLGLLWREPPAGQRSGISTASVTALAIDLADRDGIDAVTLRRIAQDAGVTAMALYPHIGGRPELIELMLDRVAAEAHELLAIPERADWRVRMEAIAQANWTTCLRHPWITALPPSRAVPGPGRLAKYEAELRALDGIGLADIEMEHTLTALVTFVHGVARATLATRLSHDRSGQDDAQWWQQVGPALSALVNYERVFPTATRVSTALGSTTGKANDPEGAWRFGLALLLDGLTRRRRRSAS